MKFLLEIQYIPNRADLFQCLQNIFDRQMCKKLSPIQNTLIIVELEKCRQFNIREVESERYHSNGISGIWKFYGLYARANRICANL